MQTHRSLFPALRVASIYFIISFLWILFSDKILNSLISDIETQQQLQTYKGWFFVIISAIVIYFLVYREIKKKNFLLNLINKRQEWYNELAANIPGIDIFLIDPKKRFLLLQGSETHKSGLKLTDFIEKRYDELESLSSEIVSTLDHYFDNVINGHSIQAETQWNSEWVEIKGIPIKNGQGIMGAMFVSINIDHQKRLLKDIELQKNKFEELSKVNSALNQELNTSYEALLQSNKELTRSEEQYRTFVKQISDGVYRLEMHNPIRIDQENGVIEKEIFKNSYIAECNPAFLKMYSISSIDSILGRTLEFLQRDNLFTESNELISSFIKNDFQINQFITEERDGKGNRKYFNNAITGIISDKKLVRVWGTKTDITFSKINEEAIRQYQKKLKSLTYQLTVNEEEQRREIASNIHDHLSQSLVISKMLIFDLLSKIKDESVRPVLERVSNGIGEALENSRKITYDLSPPILYELGIIEAAKWLMDKIHEEYGVKTHFEETDKEIKLDDELKVAVYRIIRELTTNACKHSKAELINSGISLTEKGIKGFVEDNGLGFREIDDEEQTEIQSGFGLFHIRERLEYLGGYLNIKTEAQKGSRIEFYIPIH